MAANALIQTRSDSAVRDEAASVLATMGLTVSLHRDCYGEIGHSFTEHVGLASADDGTLAMSASDWQSFRKTIRVEMPDQAPEPDQYTNSTRKRTKHE